MPERDNAVLHVVTSIFIFSTSIKKNDVIQFKIRNSNLEILENLKDFPIPNNFPEKIVLALNKS